MKKIQNKRPIGFGVFIIIRRTTSYYPFNKNNKSKVLSDNTLRQQKEEWKGELLEEKKIEEKMEKMENLKVEKKEDNLSYSAFIIGNIFKKWSVKLLAKVQDKFQFLIRNKWNYLLIIQVIYLFS